MQIRWSLDPKISKVGEREHPNILLRITNQGELQKKC
jgi:hypothetical protein